MSTLQTEVIQTTYNGIKYRSRTEARWAVFFDKMGWNPDYEMEGYKLGGDWYLPDFFVPEINSFVEIKGVEPTYGERAKARKLAIHTQKNILILIGGPSPVSTKHMMFIPPKTQAEWESCVHPKLVEWGWYLGNFTGNPSGEVYFNRLEKSCLFLGEGGNVIDSLNAGRAARFGVHD